MSPPSTRSDRIGLRLPWLASIGPVITLAVVDTAGVDSAATVEAMRAGDLTIIPARPSALDIEASRPTVAVLTRLGRQFVFSLNMVPPGRSTRGNDASRALSLLGVMALPFIIHRQAHVDCIGLGIGATEHDDPRATDEIRALWLSLKRRLEGKHGQEAVA
jgi:chromosome partitioning protein